MPHNFIRSIRLSLWIALAFAFTSYISPDNTSGTSGMVVGNYSLETTGVQNLVLKGNVDFNTTIKYSPQGKPYSTLELDLYNEDSTNTHTLGFLISEQNNSREISSGNYRVPGKIEGLLNNFDGVFGFANIKALGELPFFAENGRIIISRIEQKVLYGTLEVKLANPEGKRLNIKGDFVAIRRTIE